MDVEATTAARQAEVTAQRVMLDRTRDRFETPKGGRNKYDYDDGCAAFRLADVMPAGSSFPYDFGFIPSTLGADGDPLDILVLMDEPAPAGRVLTVWLIGVIEAKHLVRRPAALGYDVMLRSKAAV